MQERAALVLYVAVMPLLVFIVHLISFSNTSRDLYFSLRTVSCLRDEVKMVYNTRFYFAAALFKGSVIIHNGEQHLAFSFSGDSLLPGTSLQTVYSHEASMLSLIFFSFSECILDFQLIPRSRVGSGLFYI